VQGAVFNVVTRQGVERVHGDANFYFQSDGLTGEQHDRRAGRRPPFHRDKYNDATVQLSGPIVKDKLWFFAPTSTSATSRRGGRAAEFPNKFAGRPRVREAQLAAHTEAQAAVRLPRRLLPHPVHRQRCNALTAPSTIKVEHGHNPSPNVTYTGRPVDKTYVEARISGFYGKDHGDPRSESEPG
jgi:hypothetical protein